MSEESVSLSTQNTHTATTKCIPSSEIFILFIRFLSDFFSCIKVSNMYVDLDNLLYMYVYVDM